MNIENNKYLFFVCAGLTASGSDGYDHTDLEIAALADRIHDAGIPEHIKDWFARARTGQVAVNPYWPRGSMLTSACFFVDEEYDFDRSSFFSFFDSTGVSDPIGTEDLLDWIIRLPDVLRGLDALPAVGTLWSEYSRIVDRHMPAWQDMLEKADYAAKVFYGGDSPEMAFHPNLFTPYSADFVRVWNRIITIASVPDAETMLHETLHTSVAEAREKILAFAETHGLGAFANKDKMLEFGYMEDESAASATHAIEECFVRALAVTLAGGDEERLGFHAAYGCTSVPLIASRMRCMKPSAQTLSGFIQGVLDEMKEIEWENAYMCTTNADFILRRAERQDTPLILELILELAVYEKMTDQVSATVEGLEKSLFDEKGAEVYLAEYEGQTVGYLLFFYNFSTFLGKQGIYIVDIYIRPSMRGKGFGTEIFAFIKKLAAEKGCSRVEWVCLDWNEPSIDFYKKKGAVPLDEWTVYRLNID